ncbi:MAG: secretin N-terminal domain-containing protein [Pseudobdellovibrionaceae bacterium]
MKVVLTILALLFSVNSFAGMKFSFQSEDILKMIDVYSKATGQKFVVDPGVQGKGTITGADNVPPEEAFNLLSSVLSTNGYAISKQDDTMVVKAARHIQRDLIETTTTLPTLKPERIATYIYTFKNIPAESVMREVRILASRDGEMNVYSRTNQIIFSDWSSNLHRIDMILKQLDQPTDPKVAKLIESYQKTAKQTQKPRAEMKESDSSSTPTKEKK